MFHWKPAKKIKVGVVLGLNLGKIGPSAVKKVKKQALSVSFFHILLGEYPLKQKVVVVKIFEWKFKVNQSSHYEECDRACAPCCTPQLPCGA